METEHAAVVTRPKLVLPASRRINTLVREGNCGIISRNARADSDIPAPKYFTKTKMSSGGDRKIKLEDNMFYKYVLTNPQFWNSLGNSWYQFTPANSGSSSHCGLHTILECDKHLFGCLYEPQTTLGHIACVAGGSSGTQPGLASGVGVEYNLEVSLKHMKSPNVGSCVIFAFKSIFNFSMLVCDVANKSWELVTVRDEHYCVVRESTDLGIKENTFQNVLMQIRNDCVSVDVNGRGVFTSVRMQTAPGSVTEPQNGLLGIMCKQSKVIMKGWRISRPAVMTTASPGESVFGGPSSQLAPGPPTETNLSMTSGASIAPPAFTTALPGGGRRPRSLADMLAERSGGGDVLPPAQPAAAVTVPRRGPPPAPYGGGGPSNSTASTSASSSAGATTPRNAHDLAQYQASVASARDAIRQIYEDDLRHTEEDTPPPNYDGSSRRSDPTPAPVQTVEEAAAAITAEGNTQQQLQQLRSHLHGLMHSAEIVDSILRDVVLPESISVTFQDIGALTKAKQILQEAVILPVLLPELFVGLREPWKGVLLFGPPGTGKTLLAKAVASLSSSTFINCSSATILCKYRGDSEKTIKCLFDAARACTPSILFIDEIDGLVGHKSGQNSEHEATRRLKTEFFTQMDGLSTTAHKNAGKSSINPDSKSNSVLVLATTNTPWELDEALRRRFEKRIYIALPDAPARKEIFQLYLEKMKTDEASAVVEGAAAESQCNLSSGDLDVLVSLSEGYSGADIYNVCREASMIPLRQFMLSVPNPMDLALMKAQGKIVVPKIMLDDFEVAIQNTKPSVSQHNYLHKFEQWNGEFGSK